MCGLAAAILRVAILFLSMLRVRILARLILLALLRALLTIVRVLTVLLAGVFQLMSHDITLGDIGKSAGFQTTCKQRAKRVDVNLAVSARDICDEALHTTPWFQGQAIHLFPFGAPCAVWHAWSAKRPIKTGRMHGASQVRAHAIAQRNNAQDVRFLIRGRRWHRCRKT